MVFNDKIKKLRERVKNRNWYVPMGIKLYSDCQIVSYPLDFKSKLKPLANSVIFGEENGIDVKAAKRAVAICEELWSLREEIEKFDTACRKQAEINLKRKK
jgi:hypothetical protein